MTPLLEVHVLQSKRNLFQITLPQLFTKGTKFLKQMFQRAVFVLVRYDEACIIEADLSVDRHDVGMLKIHSFVTLEGNQTDEFVLPLPVGCHVATLNLYLPSRTLALLLQLENEFFAGNHRQLNILHCGSDGSALGLASVR